MYKRQTVISEDGQKRDFTCRYINEAHLEVGNSLYHICEFAERMERSGNTYQPKETPLPRECLSTLPSSGEMILITRYQKGYTPRSIQKTPEENRAIVDRYNKNNGISLSLIHILRYLYEIEGRNSYHKRY